MFNHHFIRCAVALFLLFLFALGYYFYNNHVEFRDFMSGHLEFQKIFLDTEGSQDTRDNPDGVTNGSTASREPHWSTYDKRQWEMYWSSHSKPVKVRYAETGRPDDEGVKTASTPRMVYKKDLIPQLVETPDGQVRKMYWIEKLKPGQAVPPPEAWPIMLQVTVDGVTYDVPEGETSDSYIDKIRLSTMYDISLEDVGRLIEAGMIPSSPIEAQYDPLFADPLFSRREDSRPLEARSKVLPWGPPPESEIIYLDENEKRQLIQDMEALSGGETEGGSSGEIDTVGDSVSEQSSLADDFDNSFPDDLLPSDTESYEFDKPNLPQSVADLEKQLTPAGIEAELSEGGAADSFDKAQQLIDQYGTEEGLRRLREMDPDAARRFESDKSRPGQERRPPPAREAPDEVESSTQ